MNNTKTKQNHESIIQKKQNKPTKSQKIQKTMYITYKTQRINRFPKKIVYESSSIEKLGLLQKGFKLKDILTNSK